MNTRIIARASTLALLTLAGTASAQDSSLAANVAVTSDYVFRGISQNDEGPALQAGATYTHRSGWYAGGWGSQVDFGDAIGADVEVDAFVGYRRALSQDWTADVQLLRYIFPGTADGVDWDFNELIGVVSYRDRFKATVAWSNDVFNTSQSGLYLAANAMFPLPREVTLDLGVGQYSFADDVFAGNEDDYRFWSVGVSRSFGAVGASLTHIGTDGNAGELFGTQLAGNRWMLTLTYNF